MCQSSCHKSCCHSCCCNSHCYHAVSNCCCTGQTFTTTTITGTIYECCRCKHRYTSPSITYTTNPGWTVWTGVANGSNGINISGNSGNFTAGTGYATSGYAQQVRKCTCGPHQGCDTNDGAMCTCQCKPNEVCTQCYNTCGHTVGYSCPKCSE